jgi:hypothetical protein
MNRLLIASLLLLTACVDLSAVRQFAKMSAATADYQQLINDYVNSPKRAARWAAPNRVAELEKQAEKRAAQHPQLGVCATGCP